MTQSLGAKFPEILDEVQSALDEGLAVSAKDEEWQPVDMHNLLEEAICRTSNRMFVGLPLCRDEQYTKISREFSMSVITSGLLINLFPGFLKPLVGRYLSPTRKAIRGFEKYLIPVIEERQRRERNLGAEWEAQKPLDFLQWMMDDRVGSKRDASDLIKRLLTLNFASTHTTSMSLTHVVYWLASRPQDAEVLREEVQAAVKEHGWTRKAVNAMRKMDSFMRECTRCSGLMAMGLPRKAMRDVKLSDGTLVPKGARVAMNVPAIYNDPDIFPEPEKFDPWRAYRKVVDEKENENRHAMTTASGEFFIWGGGEHVCAGRFFAVLEMKTILAHLLENYDMRFESGERPKDQWIGYSCLPDLSARVLVRRRKAE